MSEEQTNRPVKFYTRARKFPRLIGTTLGGQTLPGGPYTARQLVVVLGVLVLATKTSGLWGAGMGGLSKVLVIVFAALGSAALTRHLPTFTRNPLSLIAGLLRVLTSPTTGRLRGRPVRLPPINAVKGYSMIDDGPARTAGHVDQTVPDTAPHADAAHELPVGRCPADVHPGPTTQAPAAETTSTGSGMSRVSALLAAAAASSARPDTPTEERPDAR